MQRPFAALPIHDRLGSRITKELGKYDGSKIVNREEFEGIRIAGKIGIWESGKCKDCRGDCEIFEIDNATIERLPKI